MGGGGVGEGGLGGGGLGGGELGGRGLGGGGVGEGGLGEGGLGGDGLGEGGSGDPVGGEIGKKCLSNKTRKAYWEGEGLNLTIRIMSPYLNFFSSISSLSLLCIWAMHPPLSPKFPSLFPLLP